jgi:uncharacterized membrane-anchored protein
MFEMTRVRVFTATIFIYLAASTALAQEAAVEPPLLNFQHGPAIFAIGEDLAEIELSEDFLFLDRAGTEKFLALTENPLSGMEQATVLPASEDEQWFVIFEWDDIGYVPDEDSDLDADALLESIVEGTQAANEEREKLGWATMDILGWHDEPRYDEETNNLTWAVAAQIAGSKSVNRIVKVLGRLGVMTITLVASPDQLSAADPELAGLLGDYHFQQGNTYAEYLPGTDKLAEYGLAALVVGGAGAALVKSGLLARFWKFIVVGVVGVAGVVRRFFRGERAEDQPISKA